MLQCSYFSPGNSVQQSSQVIKKKKKKVKFTIQLDTTVNFDTVAY